jgi:hypothetical protein
MKHLKKFNESKEEISEDLIHDILQDYKSEGYYYSLKFKAFAFQDDQNWFMPIGGSNESESVWKWVDQQNEQGKGYYKGWQVSFSEIFEDGELMASDVQRGENRRNFGVPTEELYKFFEITKDVQYKFEEFGYNFLLSTHQNGEFDLMIIEAIRK